MKTPEKPSAEKTGETAEKIQKSRIFIRQGRWRDAELISDALFREYPGNGDVLKLHSAVQAGQGKTDEAIALLKKASELFPGDMEASEELAVLLLKSRRFEEASAQAAILKEICEKQSPPDEETLNRAFLIISASRRLMPESAVTESNHKAVIEYWDRRLKDNPADELLLLSKAAYLRAGGRYDEAVEIYRTVREAEPENLFAPLLLGKTLMEKGDYQAARKQFEKTLGKNDKNFRAYRNIAWFYFMQAKTAAGDKKSEHLQKSTDYYNKALNLSPAPVDKSFLLLKIAENFYFRWTLTKSEKHRLRALEAFEKYRKTAPSWISTDGVEPLIKSLKEKKPLTEEAEEDFETEIHPVIR